MQRRQVILGTAALAGLGLSQNWTVALAQEGASVLKVGLYRAILPIDPSRLNNELLYVLYEGLTTIDMEGNLVPLLAAEWQRTDNQTWRFTLRDGIVFSDGTPCNAQSVADYIAYVIAENSTLNTSGRWRELIAGGTAINTLTVEIKTNYPYLALPERITTLPIAKIVEGASTPMETYVGTGPYTLVSVDLENGAVALRNESYWGERPEWERLEYIVLASEESRLLALQAHQVDLVVQIDPRTIQQISGDDYYRTGLKPSSWINVIRLKEAREGSPLVDVRVRQALNYGIDKQAIIDGLFQGSVEPSPGQVLVEGWEYINPALTAYPYDPEKAKALLAEAGHAEGLSLQLDMSGGSYLAVSPATQVIVSQLAAIGVNVSINTLPFSTFVDESRKPETGDMFYIGHNVPYGFAPERLVPFMSTNNQSHWSSPDFDAAVNRAIDAQTVEGQRAALDEATQIFRDDPHVVFLYPQPVTWAVRSDLNWQPRRDQGVLPHTVTSL